MRTTLCTRNLALLGVLSTVACLGTVGDGGSNPGSSSGTVAGSSGNSPGSGSVAGSPGGPSGSNGSGGVSTQACTQGASFAPARLTLISDDQYRNIVHDVFGVTFPATNVTAAPSNSGSYAYDEGAALQATTVQEYQRAADTVASLMPSIPPSTPAPL